MGVIIGFNVGQFTQTFPEFAYIPAPQLTNYFNLATQYVRNDGGGPVEDTQTQTNLLYLVTAHITKLLANLPNGQPASGASGQVGRIQNASEGSVSVGLDMGSTTNQEAWFNQTQYGAMFWAASRPFRTMRWIPPRRRRIFNPWRGWGAGGWGGWGP